MVVVWKAGVEDEVVKGDPCGKTGAVLDVGSLVGSKDRMLFDGLACGNPAVDPNRHPIRNDEKTLFMIQERVVIEPGQQVSVCVER